MLEKDRIKFRKILITIVILTASCCMLNGLFAKLRQKPEGNTDLLQFCCNMVSRQMEETWFMILSYLGNGNASENDFFSVTDRVLEEEIPLYGYLASLQEKEETEDKVLGKLIEHQEGTDEETKNIEENSLDYDENAMHIENSMLEEMQKENSRFLNEASKEETDGEEEEEAGEENPDAPPDESFEAQQYPAYSYDWSEQWGYEELVSNFYAVDNTTSLKEEYISLDNLLYQDLSVDKNSDGPQILIYHTHSQEGFADSVPGDSSTTIVGAGEKLAGLLSEEYGFQVLHHTGEYDVENRDYAYNNSLPALEKILAENPTIEVVIDLHRDAVKEGKKLVIDLQGRPTARFMLFNGMSHIRDKGDITYLENPYIQDNLAFSFQAQVAANEYYPGIARKIYLRAYRYNMHLKPKSMLIELGAQTNTVEEIMNACDPLAHIISIVLGG